MRESDVSPVLPRCSQESLAAAEPLAGTAAEVRRWIALEVRAPWSERGFPDVDLPADTITLLRGLRGQGARIQLIRQPGRQAGPLRVLVADGLHARAWGFDLADYAALAGLPWETLLAEVPDGPEAARLTAPAVLVCTHGRRDRCCALLGTATWQALADLGGAEVWQTTHLGGHRFAPTLLSLPDGVCYGRLGPEDAPALLAALSAGRTHDPARWRGRCAWPPPAQAAEIAARQGLADPGCPAADVRLLDCTPQADGGWQVRLAVADTVIRRVVVQATLPGAQRRKSCGDTEAEPVRWLQVLAD